MVDNPDDEKGRTATDGRAASLPPSDAFEIVAARPRRQLLAYFLVHSTSVAQIDELVEFIASQEDGPPDCTALAIAIQHQHLPMLAEKDVVEVDRRSGFVRYRGDPLVESCLELVFCREQ